VADGCVLDDHADGFEQLDIFVDNSQLPGMLDRRKNQFGSDEGICPGA